MPKGIKTNKHRLKTLTVGALKRFLAKLPDSTPIYPRWDGPAPGDDEPGVELCGFRDERAHVVSGGLAVLVKLFHLEGN
jgi:hypothetical protein